MSWGVFPVFLFTGRVHIRLIVYLSIWKNSLVKLSGSRDCWFLITDTIYFLVCVCMISCFSHVRFFVTLWTMACQFPLFMGSSRQEYWSVLPFSTPGDLPDPGIEPNLLCLLHWKVGSLSLVPPGKSYFSRIVVFYFSISSYVIFYIVLI